MAPPRVVTTTSFVPSVPAGVVMVTEVSLTMDFVAAFPSTVIPVVQIKPVPVSVETVPPGV